MNILLQNDEITITKEAVSSEEVESLLDIGMYKLITGEVIVSAEVQDEDGITFYYPASIVMDPDNQGAALIPYGAVYTIDPIQELPINHGHILHAMDIPEAYLTPYYEMVNDIINGGE